LEEAVVNAFEEGLGNLEANPKRMEAAVECQELRKEETKVGSLEDTWIDI
jgi:hypothetical protein